MFDYFIRVAKADHQAMIELGVKLGALAVDKRGNVSAPGGAWDWIGEIQRPTGETITTEDGLEVPVMAPILGPDGEPYLHANLRTPLHLGRKAREMAANDPSIAAALAQQGKWFVIGEDGQAAAPKQPHRVWF